MMSILTAVVLGAWAFAAATVISQRWSALFMLMSFLVAVVVSIIALVLE